MASAWFLTNETALISDVESISGTGLDFRLDSISPTTATWTCDSSLPSGFTTGPYACTSNTQTGDGNATYNKTVRLDQRRITTGILSDTATVNAADGFTTSASATVNISSSALVSLTINKTISNILQGSETETFNFEVRGPSPATTVVATPSITFSAGETSKSVTVGSLAPGSYEVTELSTPGFAPVSSPQAVAINLPDCSGSVTFESSCCTTATRIPTSPPTARPPSGS